MNRNTNTWILACYDKYNIHSVFIIIILVNCLLQQYNGKNKNNGNKAQDNRVNNCTHRR